MSFDRLGLPDRALGVLHRLGWREPTPIQEASLPPLLQGKDLVGEAETGSGKTGAYGFPLVEAIRGPGVKGLVVVPTRELAVQVAGDLNAYAEGLPFRAVPVYGGVPHEPQVAALREPDATCVVGTPGRLLDLVRDRRLDLSGVTFAVVDEADRLLDLGFIRDLERILEELPAHRQTAMFSATMPPAVVKLARKFLANPRHVVPGGRPTVPERSEHFRVDVASSMKREALLALLRAEAPTSCIVFARRRADADDVGRWLAAQGLPARALHGDLPQPLREAVLGDFRSGALRVLVATDVAARGLDIEGVTHVVNYHVPEEPGGYVHRAGRTARAGRAGRVFTIVSERDVGAVPRSIEGAGVRLRRYRLEGFEAPQERPGAPKPAVHVPPKKKRDKKRDHAGWVDRKRR